jgi:sec-independent protein translocase protein TatA
VFTLLFLNQPWTWIIILAVILLLFGATRLPALAKSLGQSARVLRKELKADDTEGASTSTEGDTPADKK